MSAATTDRLNAAKARLLKARGMADMVARPQWACARPAARKELADAWREFVAARSANLKTTNGGAS